MFNKFNSNLTSGLVFLGCVLLATSAFADRRSSLAGNVLIEDADDVFFFPQAALKHRNLVSFDLAIPGELIPIPRNEDDALVRGENAMNGSGLLLFGEEGFAFGISTHRQDIFGTAPQGFLGVGDLQLYNSTKLSTWSILGVGSPTPGGAAGSFDPVAAGSQGGAFIAPLQMADVIVAFGLGEANSLGLRLSIGQAGASQRVRGAGELDLEDSWNTTAINLTAGFQHKSEIQLDLGLELGLAFFSNNHTTSENTPNYNDSGILAPSLSLYGRSLIPLRESVSLGAMAIIHVNSSSFSDEFGVSTDSATEPNDASTSAFNLFVEAGAGPVYNLPDNTTISAYGTIGFGTSSFAFESDEKEVSTTALVLPGFKLALEHDIVKWLTFRTGMSSRYNFTFQTVNFSDNATANQQLSGTYYEFMWSAGIGLNFGNFALDGTFQAPFLTDGPNFLGGKANGVFGLVSASYKF